MRVHSLNFDKLRKEGVQARAKQQSQGFPRQGLRMVTNTWLVTRAYVNPRHNIYNFSVEFGNDLIFPFL